MQIEKIKKTFLKILIGSLIAAATIAVVAVLVGDLTDVLSKALGVIFSVAIHSLLIFSFVSNREDLRQPSNLFSTTVFLLIATSFFVATFGVLELIGSELMSKAYGTIALLGFAALHGDALNQLQGFSDRINTTIYANYALMALAVMLLLPVINIDFDLIDGFYGRLTAAVLIVDFTLTLVAYILFKMFANENQELVASKIGGEKKSNSSLAGTIGKLLLLYIGLQIVFGLGGLLFF